MFHNFVSVFGVVLATTIGATIAVSASNQDPEHFVTTYLNGQGQRLTLGSNHSEWSTPIDRSARKDIIDIAIQNNTCVSLTMTKQLVSAKESCERALHLGTVELQPHNNNKSPADTFYILAVVSSNLGVVNVLLGNESIAAANFDEARRLDPEYGAPKHNLALLEVRRAWRQSANASKARVDLH